MKIQNISRATSDGSTDGKSSSNNESDHPNSPSWSDTPRPVQNVDVSCLACHWDPFYYFFFNYLSNTPISTLTGTIICPADTGAKVRLCLQRTPRSLPPALLELPLRTSEFAGLVQLGTARMVFMGRELGGPMWVMLCNGKSMGVARKKDVVDQDRELLRMINAVSTGAGELPSGDGSACGLKYLRGQFEMPPGPDDSAFYRLVDPCGSLGQDLSFFFTVH